MRYFLKAEIKYRVTHNHAETIPEPLVRSQRDRVRNIAALLRDTTPCPPESRFELLLFGGILDIRETDRLFSLRFRASIHALFALTDH
jgi:hypothetical protein